MTKEEAVEYMVNEIEKIEAERMAEHFSIEANKLKKEVTEKILSVLKEVEIKDENK